MIDFQKEIEWYKYFRGAWFGGLVGAWFGGLVRGPSTNMIPPAPAAIVSVYLRTGKLLAVLTPAERLCENPYYNLLGKQGQLL